MLIGWQDGGSAANIRAIADVFDEVEPVEAGPFESHLYEPGPDHLRRCVNRYGAGGVEHGMGEMLSSGIGRASSSGVAPQWSCAGRMRNT